MHRFLLIALICLFSWQCTTSAPPRKAAIAPVQVIFVPGYYGSTLTRETDGKTIWFTGSQSLWGDQTLALDTDGLNIPGATSFQVGEILRSVDFVSSVISKDIYGNIIDGLSTRLAGHTEVVPFAYDWRKDIASSAQQLAEQVEVLYAAGASKVVIVAHSMGGLVASYYLLYGNQDLTIARLNLSGAKRIHAVVMAGVPFKGTLAVFRNMQFGIEFGLNSKALEGLAVASFPASYQILPNYPQALTTLAGTDVSDWVLNDKRWDEESWSLMNTPDEPDEATRKNRVRYTSTQLARAKTFHKKLNASSEDLKNNLPFLYFYGDTEPTLHGALWHEAKRQLLFPEKNLEEVLPGYDPAKLLRSGDGTVTVEAAQPPQSFTLMFPELKIKKQDEEHLDLLKDEDRLDEIADFIKQAPGG